MSGRTLAGVILRASTRPQNDTAALGQEITAEHDDYEQALEALHRQVPDGWVLLHVARD